MPESVGLMEMYKNTETRHLYCIDWDEYSDQLAVWGNEADDYTYQRFEWVLVPCNYRHTDVYDLGESVS